MPYIAIQRTYHSGIILLDKEKKCIEDLHFQLSKGNITIDEILKRCICNRHFRYLHLTSSMRPIVVQNLKNKLSQACILSNSYSNFEDLYNDVNNAIGSVQGIGRTMLYDITRMIGYYHSIYPKKYVYLHAGAKKGAKKILGKSRLSYRIDTNSLTVYFPNEESMYIEDILCIYKEKF